MSTRTPLPAGSDDAAVALAPREAAAVEAGRLPLLLHFRVSHYNEKVRWALDLKGWRHRRKALIAGFHIPRVRWLTGQNQVPVLQLGAEVLHDSTTIIAELERRQPEPALYPEDPEQRARALQLEEHFDEVMAPDLRRLFWSCYLRRSGHAARMATGGYGALHRLAWRAAWPLMRPAFSRNMGLDRASVEAARGRLQGHCDRLEAEIGPSGFLVGDRFTIADLTAAAVMTALLRPPEFPYALPEPWPPELVTLRESVVHRKGAQWANGIYARHRGRSCAVGE